MLKVNSSSKLLSTVTKALLNLPFKAIYIHMNVDQPIIIYSNVRGEKLYIFPPKV